MRKLKLISLFLGIVLLFISSGALLSSCHGQRELSPFVCPDRFDERKPVEITFWAKNDSNATQVKIYRKAIADFEALYPNVKVTLTLYTDYGRIYNDVITNIQTNTTPNVCITYPDHIATYMTGANVVVPIGELFDNEKYGLGGSELKFDGPSKEEIVPKFLGECKINDEYYALPFMRSTEACYVNKTYIEKLGYTLPETLTWDFIWEVSEKAMEKNEDGTYKVNSQTTLIPFIYKSTDNMMIQMLEQKDAGYSTDGGEVKIFNNTTEELLYTIAEHAGTRSFSTFKISSYPGNFLNKGQCIFAIDSTAGATWMGADAPLVEIADDQRVDFETVVMTVPQFDTENPEMISQGPSVCVFNKADEQEVLASWLFTQFLLTNNVQIAYAQTEGYVPVTSKAQQTEEYLDYLSREGEDNQLYYDIKIQATKLLIENTENTFVTPVFNGSASLRNAAGELIESVTKSMRRSETVDDAYMDELFARISSLYRIDEKTNEKDETTKPLPPGSVVLLVSLGVIWLIIITVFVVSKVKSHKAYKKVQ